MIFSSIWQQKTNELISGFQSIDISATKNKVDTRVGDNTKEWRIKIPINPVPKNSSWIRSCGNTAIAADAKATWMGNVRGKKKTKILCCEVLGVNFFLGGDALATLEVVPFLYHMRKPIPPTNIGVLCSFLLLFFFPFNLIFCPFLSWVFYPL